MLRFSSRYERQPDSSDSEEEPIQLVRTAYREHKRRKAEKKRRREEPSKPKFVQKCIKRPEEPSSSYSDEEDPFDPFVACCDELVCCDEPAPASDPRAEFRAGFKSFPDLIMRMFLSWGLVSDINTYILESNGGCVRDPSTAINDIVHGFVVFSFKFRSTGVGSPNIEHVETRPKNPQVELTNVQTRSVVLEAKAALEERLRDPIYTQKGSQFDRLLRTWDEGLLTLEYSPAEPGAGWWIDFRVR